MGKKPSSDPHQVWIEQLRQITGISEPVAYSIAKHFPTLKSLALEYARPPEQLSDIQKMHLLRDIMIEHRNKSVGPTISKKVYQIFTEERHDVTLS